MIEASGGEPIRTFVRFRLKNPFCENSRQSKRMKKKEEEEEEGWGTLTAELQHERQKREERSEQKKIKANGARGAEQKNSGR